eukprot:5947947-Alexandrium_andersonii.AAC.1
MQSPTTQHCVVQSPQCVRRRPVLTSSAGTRPIRNGGLRSLSLRCSQSCAFGPPSIPIFGGA